MVLLDTSAVVWLAQAPEALSERARQAIRSARAQTGLALSDKTLWEIAMIVSRGQIRVKLSLEDFLRAIEKNFRILPITSAVAVRSVQFSANFPKDPSDRIIGATALVHGMFLVTADKAIRESGEVPCIW